jgi:phosphoribosylanthranilate isomerase
MTWVKICGITNLEDALTAVEAGADALGFVFYEKSPRKVEVEKAREIVLKLPERVEKVGVFVDESAARVREIAGRSGLTGLQLHAITAPRPAGQDLRTASTRNIFAAIPARLLLAESEEFEGLGYFKEPGDTIEGILFDSGGEQVPGGTGKVFDWAKMAAVTARLSSDLKVIVAGGLTPANVSDAMRLMRPWGVDVASGVEARAGKKDPDKVRAFIAAVREADKVH